MKLKKHIILTVILLGWAVGAYAQFVPATSSPGSNRRNDLNNTNNTTNPFPSHEEEKNDTLPKGIIFDYEVIPDSTLLESVYYFFLKPFDSKIYQAYHPTLLPDFIEQSDALCAFNNNYYQTTGNFGSPHQSLYPRFGQNIDFDYQPSVFGGYGYSLQNLHFYQTSRPYTVLGFFNSTVSDYQVRVVHTQNLTQRWNIALHYDLINSEGAYSNQKTLNNYLGFSTNYFSKNLRYQVKAGAVWKNLNIQENGGIAADSLFTENVQTNRSGIPVNMYDAATKYNNFAVVAHQSYNFARKIGTFIHTDTVAAATDSSAAVITYDTTTYKGSPFNFGVISHQITLDNTKRNFYHSNIDPLYYPNIYVDSTNTFDSVSYLKIENMLFWSNDAYKDYDYKNPFKLSVGIRHICALKTITYGFDYGYVQSLWINSLLPFAKADISLGKFAINLFAEKSVSNFIDIQDNNLLKGKISYTANDHVFSISAYNSHKSPDLFYNNYFGNNYHWGNREYKRIRANNIEFEYNWKDYIELLSGVTNAQNMVWLDTNSLPFQTDQSAWLAQTRLNTNLHVGRFHWKTFNLLQFTSNSDVFRVPVFACKHSFFADFKLFKNALALQAGVDLRYNTAYYADAYNPALGSFYRQDDIEIGNHIWTDIFTTLQIKHATIFVKLLHINALLESTPDYFVSPHYPGYDFMVQWGFVWKFFD